MSTTPPINYDALQETASSSTVAPQPTTSTDQSQAPPSNVNYDALGEGATASTMTPPPTPGFFSRAWGGVKDAVNSDPNIQAIIGASEGATNVTQNPIGYVAGLAKSAFPGTSVVQDLMEVPSEYRAYENARVHGASITDAARIADQTYVQKNQNIAQLKETVKKFADNPSRALGKTIAEAVPVILGYSLGAAPGAPGAIEGTTEPEYTAEQVQASQTPTSTATEPQPSIYQQATKGADVAQAPAQNALRAAGQDAAENSGVADEVSIDPKQGIRTIADDTIKAATTKEAALYDKINTAAETDMKSLYDYQSELQDALDDPTQIANRKSLTDELKTTQDQIKTGESNAASKGVTPETLNEAKAATQQRYALQDVKNKLFNSEGTVEGDVAHGTPETLNVKNAITKTQQLTKPSKFAPEGSPNRLEQALGKQGAKNLLDRLYAAQRAGKAAVRTQEILGNVVKGAKVVGKVGTVLGLGSIGLHEMGVL